MWGTLMDPPDAFTTTVEAPDTNPPAEVFIERRVMMLGFAVNELPVPTVNVPVVIGKPEPEVDSVVAPEAP
jgi:hypothetical protein